MPFTTTLALADAIRRRELSSIEALERHLAQIAAHDELLHAAVALDPSRARADARAADAALARGDPCGPLHGVPFLLKDTHDAAGWPSTAGSPLFERYVAGRDSPVVARLRASGAVLMGRSNVAEMLADFQCRNRLFGITSNPWNPARTSGGSSGGAAAAVATGMTPFDIGTDLSGSIRLPAAFCGVYGLKPTEHRVPLAGAFPDPRHAPRGIRAMSCIGPIARSIDDLGALLAIIGGPDPLDADVPPVPLGTRADSPPALRSLRLAVTSDLAGLPLARTSRQAFEALARALAGAGAHVDAALPAGLDIPADLASAGELIGIMLGAFQGPHPPSVEHYLRALDRRDRSIAAWDAFFDDWDALICPVSIGSAFAHCEPGAPLPLDGHEVPYLAVSGHAALFNYSGHPALSMPCGVDAHGLPLAVQLVARRWDDARLLDIARCLEPFTGGFSPPPGY